MIVQAENVFVEAALSRLLPIYHEVTLSAIRHFAFADYPQSAAIAAVGALLASVALYVLGRWFRRIPEKRSGLVPSAAMQAIQARAEYWLPWVLILSPTPMGGAIVMAAGFFRLRPALAAVMVLASEALWRVSPML